MLACAVAGREQVTAGIFPGRYFNRKVGPSSGEWFPGSGHGEGVRSPNRAQWTVVAEGD